MDWPEVSPLTLEMTEFAMQLARGLLWAKARIAVTRPAGHVANHVTAVRPCDWLKFKTDQVHVQIPRGHAINLRIPNLLNINPF